MAAGRRATLCLHDVVASSFTLISIKSYTGEKRGEKKGREVEKGQPRREKKGQLDRPKRERELRKGSEGERKRVK